MHFAMLCTAQIWVGEFPCFCPDNVTGRDGSVVWFTAEVENVELLLIPDQFCTY